MSASARASAAAASRSLPGRASGSVGAHTGAPSSRSQVPPSPRLDQNGATPTRAPSPSLATATRSCAPFGAAVRHHASIQAGLA